MRKFNLILTLIFAFSFSFLLFADTNTVATNVESVVTNTSTSINWISITASIIALGLVLFFSGFFSKDPKKQMFLKKYGGMLYAAFNFAEKAGAVQNLSSNDKLNTFIKTFVEKYTSRFGQEPDEAIKQYAIDLIEQLIAKKNSGGTL